MDSRRKTTFNKREYFKQKYKKNYGSQQEGHGRALLQKKAFVRQYYKEKKWQERKEMKRTVQDEAVRNEREMIPDPPVEDKINENEEEETAFSEKKKQKMSSLKRARLQYHQKVAERKEKKEAFFQKKKEIALAKIRRKEERLKRFKKLNQKTKKGQPVMRGRIELMLEKLEKEMSL
ncbi:uncharacterized protein [Palaemon carinicauda]|uniref:uncharacterized protein n=1 Tax=Palaemon carinicauda TaxID=392227 RepID=UPI0035B59E65